MSWYLQNIMFLRRQLFNGSDDIILNVGFLFLQISMEKKEKHLKIRIIIYVRRNPRKFMFRSFA